MRDKYQIPKTKKPETKQDVIAEQIEELVRRRDTTKSLSEKQTLNSQITKLFAEWQRLKI